MGDQIASYEALLAQKDGELSEAYGKIDAQKALLGQIETFLDRYADVSISDAVFVSGRCEGALYLRVGVGIPLCRTFGVLSSGFSRKTRRLIETA